MDKIIYTPGPTQVHPSVLTAMSTPTTNSDLDPDFYELFRNQSDRLTDYMGSSGTSLILLGEAILGLEASLATFLNRGDQVVSVANGIFGHGFADFAKMYGGNPVKIKAPFASTNFDFDQLNKSLKDAKICTMVHCETPSGLLNPVEKVGKLCEENDVLFIVDAVSSVFGTEVEVDEWNIDILLGGTQKALSAPTGLTLITLSEKATDELKNVSDTSSGFYANLTHWSDYLDGTDWLPYTHSESLIYALEAAFDLIDNEGLENVITRHQNISGAVRKTMKHAGLELFPDRDEDNSPTVTAVKLPIEIENATEFIGHLRDKYNLLISGSLGELSGKILRLGHMGNQANIETTTTALDRFEQGLIDFDVELEISNISDYFLSEVH